MFGRGTTEFGSLAAKVGAARRGNPHAFVSRGALVSPRGRSRTVAGTVETARARDAHLSRPD